MTPGEIREIATIMKQFGMTHLKTSHVEMSMPAQSFSDLSPKQEPGPIPHKTDTPPEEAEKIEHKVVELAGLMKLSDNELVDRLFPEPKEDEEEHA